MMDITQNDVDARALKLEDLVFDAVELDDFVDTAKNKINVCR
ncbi:hypothetical protein ACH0AH_01015 [Microbacterium paludicola]